MKRVALFLLLALALSGCTRDSSNFIQGEVLDCESINLKAGELTPLECLGGGAPIATDEIAGPALINVWGTWCKPCREELPHLREFYEKSKDQVNVIGVAVEEKSQAAVIKFIESNGMNWPVLYDADGSTKAEFGMGVPVTWFVDQDGEVQYKKFGPFRNVEEIESAARKYLGVK
jgi:cytochrome c biogenesis protein CcmG, thiol:disulfide interchange protein DsbE